MLRETWCVISCSLLPVSPQYKWVSLMYEREWKEMSLTNVFLPHRETFSGIFIQGICISSWPLKVHPRAVLFGMFVEMYIKCGCHGGHFLKIMKDANVTLFWPLCIVYVKLNVQDILYKFIQTNILYIFTWKSFVGVVFVQNFYFFFYRKSMAHFHKTKQKWLWG